MTKVISFPRPRFVSDQKKALELTELLRPLIVNHLKHVQMLQVGDANPNLRSADVPGLSDLLRSVCIRAQSFW